MEWFFVVVVHLRCWLACWVESYQDTFGKSNVTTSGFLEFVRATDATGLVDGEGSRAAFVALVFFLLRVCVRPI